MLVPSDYLHGKLAHYLVLERHATIVHDLLALGALCGELFLEASDAVDVRVVGDDERTTSDLKKDVRGQCDQTWQ